ncbi:MAG: DUF5977 domain-containing protein [Chitinophagaceae bacterium]
MSTGVPSIQFPLFVIKSGNINLPITLKYHAGGYKVNELPSWVGMGWTLDVGGIISKKVNGLDDMFDSRENQFPYYVFAPNNNIFHPIIKTIHQAVADQAILANSDPIAYKTFLGRIAKGNVDGEADEFIFSTPEGSGTIVYSQLTQKFQINKINGWKALFNLSNSPLIEAKWDVIGTSGVRYNFGAIELEKNPLNYNPPEEAQSYNTQLISSWHLSQVYDDINGKSISLYYNSPWKFFNTGDSYTWEITPAGIFKSGGVRGYLKEQQELTVDHINFDNGVVQFVPLTTPGSPLKEMQVKDYQNRIVKRILFDYFYDTARLANGQPDPQGLTLFLKGFREINIKANGDTVKNAPYVFNYDFNRHVPKRFSYAQDSWGFFNGKLNNPNLIPNDILVAYNSNVAGQGGDRSIDTACTKAGIIKEIIHPTGGKTVLDFENNRDGAVITGGLRVRSISKYDPVSAQTITTKYEYTDANGVGTGYRMFQPRFSYMYHKMSTSGGEDDLLKIEGQSIAPLFAQQASPIMYQQVLEKVQASQGDIITRHFFSLPVILDGGQGENDGVPYNKISYDDNAGNLEYKTELFKNTNGVQSLLKKSETNSGTLKNYSDAFWNIQAAWSYFDKWLVFTGNDPFNQIGLNIEVKTNTYRHFRESIVPKEITETEYSNGQGITQKYYFDYDTSNGNPRIVKTVDSKGDTLIKVSKYASDYQAINGSSNPWNSTINSLLASNLISLPVEVAIYTKRPNQPALLTDATLIQYAGGKVRKFYKLHSEIPVSDFQPSYNDAGGFYYDSRYKLLQEITETDANNNALTVIGDTKTESYIWDYAATLPIAHVTNAVNSNIAYTSFETAYTGNWTVSGGTVNATPGITGSRSYILSAGNSISKADLSPGQYIVSYWSKNGSMSVNGGTVTGTVTKNGWTYFEHILNGITAVTISGAGNIDEVKLYPAGALMNTYTYDPLVGMQTQCDANSKILYYEYDSFNRLSYIRDLDNNILKKICYNYAGQPENCGIYTSSDRSGIFTRNNCSAGQVGSNVTYTVPAGTYSSAISQADADNQAQADVNANGQAYANANGTCASAGCTFTINPGFTSVTNNIYNNGSTASFYMVFYSSSVMIPGNNYTIATINGSCRPSATRTITTTAGGRTWSITITPTGQMTWKITSGTALPANTTVGTSTLSYNL